MTIGATAMTGGEPAISAGRGLGCVLRLEHEPGPRGGAWAVCDDTGEQVCSLGLRPNGGTRVGVRDSGGAEQAALGEPVLSLVEHYTIWRGGRPWACVYRPGGGAHRGRWFVEIGEDQGWVVLAGRAGLRVFSGGLQVARAIPPDGHGMPTRVELAPGTDASLVLLLSRLLSTASEFPL